MAKISLRLDTRRRKNDSTYPVKIAVHRSGKTIYIPTNISIKLDEWNKDRQEVVKRQDKRTLNVVLQDKVSSMQATLIRLQNDGKLRSLTDKQLIEELTGVSDQDRPHLIKDFFVQFVSTIPNPRTRQIYEVTLKKICEFDSSKELTFESVTPSWLRAFELFLAQKAPKINARSIHMRNIRAVFNAALDDELIACYPFRRFKIKSQQTAKRALTREQLLALMSAEVEEFQRKYIDMFFLGFYLIGINVVDMARLTGITNGRIEYERAKTHKLYSIKVEPEAQQIIDKYKSEKRFLSFFDNAKNYRAIANRQNYNLKLIGNKLGIDNLTYYCCRHSWATIAAELDITDEVIAMALGHSNSSVTEVYIRRNRDKVDAANRKVIDYLLHNKK